MYFLGEHILQDGVQLAIICQKTNTLIGDVYLRQEEDVVWIGYSICPTMSRQGYAYEVISAVISFLKEKGITSIKAGIETGNVASFALINKLNFCYVEMDGNEQIFALEL